MRTMYQAVGADEDLLRLARAWHDRVMSDEVVSHAFRHGFQPDHVERLAACWDEALGGPPTYSTTYGDETSVVRIHSGNGPTRRWTFAPSPVSIRRSRMLDWPTTRNSARRCTTTSLGQPRRRWPAITTLPTMCPTG